MRAISDNQASFFLLAPGQAALSLFGTLAVNYAIASNHRPGRYMGNS